VYLLCNKATFEYLKIIKFIDVVIQQCNKMFVEIEDDAGLYLSLVQFACYYFKKMGRHEYAGCRPIDNPVLDLLLVPRLYSIEIYDQLLENIDSSQVRAKVMDAVLENVRNTPEHVGFIRKCVRIAPHLIAPCFVRKRHSEWTSLKIYESIKEARRAGKGSGQKVPRVCHFGRTKNSIVDFLIGNRIADDYLFLFMFSVSRPTFCGCFDEVLGLFKGHETFWTDLWHLILN
jgi:hypothetical protein